MKHMKTLIFLIILLLIKSQSIALDKPTHEAINGFIANNKIDQFSLDAYLFNTLGFLNGAKERFTSVDTKAAWEWIQKGGQYEDEPAYTRSRNHFHNPLLPWGQSGLNSGLLTGQSLPLWIQDQSNRRITDLGGDWSWRKAREFYYAALSGDSTALDGFKVEEGIFNSTKRRMP